MGYDYDWDERMEPGYDPGPDALDNAEIGDCERCDEIDTIVIVVAGEAVCEECYHDGGDEDGFGESNFADPGGVSALRAASPSNPRNLPCPTCKAPGRLTPADKARGYQCDECAERAERGGY